MAWNSLEVQMTMFRAAMKAVEFHLPTSLARAVHASVLRNKNPYGPREDEHRVIFIHVPKTAGTSIAAALFDRRSRHIPLVRYAAADPLRFDRYFKFCFVRNPWDRFHSAFHYLHRMVGNTSTPDGVWATEYLKQADDLASFVNRLKVPEYRRRVLQWIHFRPQYHWVSLPGLKGANPSRLAVDFVGKFEQLPADFRRLEKHLNLTGVELPRLREGTRRDYRKAYDQEMIEVVGEMYASDTAVLGYEFEHSTPVNTVGGLSAVTRDVPK